MYGVGLYTNHLELFSKKTMQEVFELALKTKSIQSENAQRIDALKDRYLNLLDNVIDFLQGKRIFSI